MVATPSGSIQRMGDFEAVSAFLFEPVFVSGSGRIAVFVGTCLDGIDATSDVGVPEDKVEGSRFLPVSFRFLRRIS